MATTVIAAFYELEGQLGYTLLNIQDEIFAYRASCPSVPNGIQLIMKPKNE